jgi:hypothetical protein
VRGLSKFLTIAMIASPSGQVSGEVKTDRAV